RSPTATERFHHFLDESGLRLIMSRLTLSLLAVVHRRAHRVSHVSRKIRIGVLKLSLGRRCRRCGLEPRALALWRHSPGGVWAFARFPRPWFCRRWRRRLRGV